ncbi:MAG TPA: hypothetical protein VLT45_25690, partial [Kofleriaceae bacterium]|nr:hypothetical protein [Kofleriaceae bacterium]
MTPELEAFLHLTAASARGPRKLDLRMPPVVLVSGKFGDEGVPTDLIDVRSWFRSISLTFVRRIDDVRLRWDGVDDIAADRELMGALIARVAAMLEQLRERGRVFALCPDCKCWEVE